MRLVCGRSSFGALLLAFLSDRRDAVRLTRRASIIGEWLQTEARFFVTKARRRFPPPWTVEEYRDISYIVRHANNFAVAYVYFEVGAG